MRDEIPIEGVLASKDEKLPVFLGAPVERCGPRFGIGGWRWVEALVAGVLRPHDALPKDNVCKGYSKSVLCNFVILDAEDDLTLRAAKNIAHAVSIVIIGQVRQICPSS